MENKEIYEALSEIKERTASVETKVDRLVEDNKKIDSVKDMAKEAHESSKSAHKRIDKVDKWLFTIGSAVALALVAAVMNIIMK